MTPRLRGVLETCLYAADLDAAETFYAGVLGLALHASEPERHRFFRCGAGMLLIFRASETRGSEDVPPHGADGAGHVAFAADWASLPFWRCRLAASGVAIEREIAWPGGAHSIYFRDPAGNSLELATPCLWGLDRESST